MGVTHTQEPSPLTYYPEDPTIKVFRSTVYNDGEEVGYVDWRNVDDATFLIFMMIQPKYREHKWLPYFQEALNHTWEYGKKFVMTEMDPALREVLPNIMQNQPAEYFLKRGGWFDNMGVEYHSTLGE
jgi:hypothetical protein